MLLHPEACFLALQMHNIGEGGSLLCGAFCFFVGGGGGKGGWGGVGGWGDQEAVCTSHKRPALVSSRDLLGA